MADRIPRRSRALPGRIITSGVRALPHALRVIPISAAASVTAPPLGAEPTPDPVLDVTPAPTPTPVANSAASPPDPSGLPNTAPWTQGVDAAEPVVLLPPPASPAAEIPHDHAGCTNIVHTDYPHVTTTRRFGAWSPSDDDYPAFIRLLADVATATSSPFMRYFVTRASDYAAHFQVESGLSNGSPTRPVVGDEGTRVVAGRTVRTHSFGIAQLHSPGLLRTYGNRNLLGRLASQVPVPRGEMVSSPATADWSPVVCTPSGMLYAAIRLREYERTLAAHFEAGGLADGRFVPRSDAGRALLRAAQALCTSVPLHVVILRSYMASSSIQGMTNYLSGRTQRRVTVRLTARPTQADLSRDPQLMHLRASDGPVRWTPTARDPWWWRSQGCLRLAWEARR